MSGPGYEDSSVSTCHVKIRQERGQEEAWVYRRKKYPGILGKRNDEITKSSNKMSVPCPPTIHSHRPCAIWSSPSLFVYPCLVKHHLRCGVTVGVVQGESFEAGVGVGRGGRFRRGHGQHRPQQEAQDVRGGGEVCSYLSTSSWPACLALVVLASLVLSLHDVLSIKILPHTLCSCSWLTLLAWCLPLVYFHSMASSRLRCATCTRPLLVYVTAAVVGFATGREGVCRGRGG